MNVSITARGYKAPDRLKAYLVEKLKRLERFEERILGLDTILSYEKLDQVVEFKLQLNNKKIQPIIIKEKSEDIFKSIDLAVDNLERQIIKHKEKIKSHDNKKIVENLAG